MDLIRNNVLLMKNYIRHFAQGNEKVYQRLGGEGSREPDNENKVFSEI